MNTNAEPNYKSFLDRIYTRMKETIRDQEITHPDVPFGSRNRLSVIVLSETNIQEIIATGYPVYELFDDALRMISTDLQVGYGHSVVAIEEFDHQGREWILGKLESLIKGDHPWRSSMVSNNEVLALFAFGYGSIPGHPPPGVKTTEYGLLPTAYAQLVDYSGEEEEGYMVQLDSWNLQKDGVFIDKDVLKQFGRPDE